MLSCRDGAKNIRKREKIDSKLRDCRSLRGRSVSFTSVLRSWDFAHSARSPVSYGRGRGASAPLRLCSVTANSRLILNGVIEKIGPPPSPRPLPFPPIFISVTFDGFISNAILRPKIRMTYGYGKVCVCVRVCALIVRGAQPAHEGGGGRGGEGRKKGSAVQ